jgi:hypothetical protein
MKLKQFKTIKFNTKKKGLKAKRKLNNSKKKDEIKALNKMK